MAGRSDYTNGKPFLVTHREDYGEFSRSIHYLLPDGTRKQVLVEQSMHDAELERKLGEALAAGRTGVTKGRK